ncbi:MAG: glycosyltransferase family 2 protein [Candidatus Omnitrophica bacterium]|nr:glycosyltransferase family 2 protein [Candidatus Omnitrophota bacterium]
MDFQYSRQGVKGREKSWQRFLEVLPGFLSWTVIIGIVVLSVLQPLTAAVVMIAFLLYWLLRLIYMNIFLLLSYTRLEIEKTTDWQECIASVDRLKVQTPVFCGPAKQRSLKETIAARIHYRQLRKLKTSKNLPPSSENIYHLLILPVIREARQVVEPAIEAVKQGSFPAERFLVIIALEDSASQKVKQQTDELREKYKNVFLDFLVILHPENQPGEAKVKGANVSFAARRAQSFFSAKGIKPENILVSCFDADTVANPDYFSCLTYHYLINPLRLQSSYQPIPVYHNNIWEVAGFARILDIGTSFFQLIEATNPGKLVTFSSHSMSFKALQDVGYWPVDMISDDSAIFWKAFIHYQGNYRVRPIYTTVSMDIAAGPGLKETFTAIYKQKRRWAWGIENFPIVVRGFFQVKKISFSRKLSYGYKLLDGFVSWATWSFLLLLGSWLPAFFASREFSSSTAYYLAPRIRGIMFSLASIGIIICTVISLLLLPRREGKHGILIGVKHILEWLFIPVALLFLSAIPALDAQTRLMFGKYMEFSVTGKYRKSKS